MVIYVVKNPPTSTGDARDLGLIPGLGRSPGEGNGNSLQYSCLKNSTHGGAWQTTAHGVTKESDETERLSTQYALYVYKILDTILISEE